MNGIERLMTVLIDTDFDTTKLPFIPCTSGDSSTSVVHSRSTQTSYPKGKSSWSHYLSFLESFLKLRIDRDRSDKVAHR